MAEKILPPATPESLFAMSEWEFDGDQGKIEKLQVKDALTPLKLYERFMERKEYLRRAESRSNVEAYQQALAEFSQQMATEKGVILPSRVDEKIRETVPAKIQSQLRPDIAACLRAAKSKVCTLPVSVEWVSRNIVRPWSEIDSSLIPSEEAVGLLKWAKANEANFRRDYDAKRMPPNRGEGPVRVPVSDTGQDDDDLAGALTKG